MCNLVSHADRRKCFSLIVFHLFKSPWLLCLVFGWLCDWLSDVFWTTYLDITFAEKRRISNLRGEKKSNQQQQNWEFFFDEKTKVEILERSTLFLSSEAENSHQHFAYRTIRIGRTMLLNNCTKICAATITNALDFSLWYTMRCRVY